MDRIRDLQPIPLTVSRWMLWVFVGCLSACGTVGQLEELKDLAGQQKYTEIAAQEVRCELNDEGCNQLHLIKGDACFRLAKAGGDPEARYAACAAKELEEGIRATRDWKSEQAVVGSRAQYYENLCESLRLLQDSQQTPAAAATNARLLSAAKAFLIAEPEHLAAIFFINSARFAQFQIDPSRLRDSASACTALNGQLAELDRAEARSGGNPYAVNYRRLRLDIIGLKRAVAGCR